MATVLLLWVSIISRSIRRCIHCPQLTWIPRAFRKLTSLMIVPLCSRPMLLWFKVRSQPQLFILIISLLNSALISQGRIELLSCQRIEIRTPMKFLAVLHVRKSSWKNVTRKKSSLNCAFLVQYTYTKTQIRSAQNVAVFVGSSCLLCLNSLGKLLALSLPNLSPLLDVECTFLMKDYRLGLRSRAMFLVAGAYLFKIVIDII